MTGFLHDLRHAVRSLGRSPGFALAAILSLALGIGGNAAIFSVVRGVLLRPAPFADIDRLAMVWETDRASNTTREPSSIPDFADFRTRSQSFTHLAAITAAEISVSVANADPERVAGLSVTANYLETTGLQVLAGRGFTREEGEPGGPRAVLISEALWDRLYQRSDAAVGATIRLNDVDWPIVGVMPDGADFGVLQVLGAADYGRGFADRGGRTRVDLWAPLRLDPQASRDNHPIIALGRLAPSASHESAQAELTAITADLERTYPQQNANRGAFTTT